MRVLLIILFTTVALTACKDSSNTSVSEPTAQSAAALPWFQDVAAESGVQFTWKSGAKGDYYLPEIIGGGAGHAGL